MGDQEKMKAEFLKQEGALPDPDTEASDQVMPRAFGVSTPELEGGMENTQPSTDAVDDDHGRD